MKIDKLLTAGALSAGLMPLQAAAQDAQIWSYWGTGAEATALEALVDVNNSENADTPIGTRTISGNSSEMRRAMQVSFLGGTPPAVYQSGFGMDLKSFLDAERIANIDSVIADVPGVAEMSSGIKRVVSFDGDMYAVPLNLHIISNVFYNTAIFDELGIEPPKTAEEFRAAAEKIDAAGYEVLGNAGGGSWTFYTAFPFLIEELGQDDLFAFTSGEIPFTDERVVTAFQEWTDTYVDNYMENWSGYSWADTAAQFAQGKVAMYQMGDWLSAYLADAGWTAGEQYDFFSAPGLDGAVVVQMDVLAKPSGLDEATSAVADAFLKTASGAEGQLAFNVKKGSVAANPESTDEGYSAYGELAYQQIQEATAADKVIPNPKFLFPTKLDEEIKNDTIAYAQDPSEEALMDMLEKLDAMRVELKDAGEFIKW